MGQAWLGYVERKEGGESESGRIDISRGIFCKVDQKSDM